MYPRIIKNRYRDMETMYKNNRFCIIEATTIGKRAYKILFSENFLGKVHSVFKNAFNIVTAIQEIISVVSKNYKSPFTIIVNEPKNFLEMGIKEEMCVIRRDDCLILPRAKLTISLKKAEVWRPPRQVSARTRDVKDLRRNINTIICVSSILGTQLGLGQLLQYIFGEFENVSIEKLNTVARIAFPRIIKLVENLRNEELDEVANASASLVGLGPGLTPSGDDMLAMLMASMWLSADYFQIDKEKIKNINEKILISALGRTNLLSQKQLEHAATGEVPGIIFDLIKAVLLSEGDLVEKTKKVLEIGASSGEDALLGIVLGLYLSMRLSNSG